MTYDKLRQRYLKAHGKLKEPRQGFSSLHPSLWLAYSMGIVRGFTDLGTYVNKSGDHGWDDVHRQALAFDLGRKDRFLNRGYNYVKARRLAKLYVRNHKALSINYVILGMRIWSRSWDKARQGPKAWNPELGWHRYDGDTSHMFHLHVSGVDPNPEA
jgi:hypothetical protein